MDFKIADGLIPNSKLVNSDILSVAFQVLGSAPNIAAGYNLAPMFSYLMKSQGARIAEFEKSPEQQAYEQAMGQWQQLAQLAIEKDTEFTAPQPTPEQFGYVLLALHLLLPQKNPHSYPQLRSKPKCLPLHSREVSL
jgi:hypothetical protein